MNVAFIGIGRVGSALAGGLAAAGHRIVVAARDVHSESVRRALEENPAWEVSPVPQAAAAAEIIFLAVPFGAAEAAVRGAGDLSGKILVDCTNPVGPGLSHGLKSETSGGEFIQSLAPSARVMKAFNTYGFENFRNPVYPNYAAARPAMFIAGDDASAKQTVGALCADLGWEPVDAGDIAMSLHLEHLALLWIKMARLQGRGPNFVWARLTR